VEHFFESRVDLQIEPIMSDKKMRSEITGHHSGEGSARPDPNRIISQKLRALYASVEQEGIPDRFVSLLEQLDEAERRQKNAETNED